MKIFTDVAKWDDKWFRSLNPTLKLVYLYVCDKSDHAGVYDFDGELLSLHTKIDFIDEAGWIDLLSPKVIRLPNGKWWIKNYIQFQYPKGINRRTNYFDPVFKSLEKNQIDVEQFEQMTLGIKHVDDKPSYDDIMKQWNAICEGLPRVSKMTDSRRSLIRSAINDKVSLQTLFMKISESDFLMGKKTDYKACFDWAMKPVNRQKIIEGNYDNAKNRGVDTESIHKGGF